MNTSMFFYLLRARIPIRTLFFFLSALTLSGCSLSKLFHDGREVAASIARTHEWKALSFDVEAFVLKGYAKDGPGKDLVVYIEGDGRAWRSRRVPSDDPTPRDPLAFRLAVRDPAPKVLYLGRPCQYVSPKSWRRCEPRFWTTAGGRATARCAGSGYRPTVFSLPGKLFCSPGHSPRQKAARGHNRRER